MPRRSHIGRGDLRSVVIDGEKISAKGASHESFCTTELIPRFRAAIQWPIVRGTLFSFVSGVCVFTKIPVLPRQQR
ncbi:hypothetical protein [Saccharopolyspora sp. SCSIO 74807]|uniref:hypothetical protein n=1 Tax=Saccharopolyspora sp. SCSIO 74807 TaxID=3118084 RepID=UPI0030D48736